MRPTREANPVLDDDPAPALVCLTCLAPQGGRGEKAQGSSHPAPIPARRANCAESLSTAAVMSSPVGCDQLAAAIRRARSHPTRPRRHSSASAPPVQRQPLVRDCLPHSGLQPVVVRRLGCDAPRSPIGRSRLPIFDTVCATNEALAGRSATLSARVEPDLNRLGLGSPVTTKLIYVDVGEGMHRDALDRLGSLLASRPAARQPGRNLTPEG